MKMYSFEKLDVWKLSRELVVDVYKIQQTFPSIERFGLCDQLRRAVVSIPSNIAEGNKAFCERTSVFYRHFYGFINGSILSIIVVYGLGLHYN